MRQASIRQLPQLDYAGNEALNTICTNLSFAGRDRKKIVLTSCLQGEGKSFLAVQIMANMARRGKRVVLLDADLRRSFMLRRYGVEIDGEVTGLVHYLAGYCDLDDIVYETDLYGACLIPTGRDVMNPMALLDTPYFGDMLDALAREFDLVLVDAPPVGMVVDAAQIARHCDGSVLVLEHAQRRRRELVEAVRQMQQSDCPVLGCVINKAKYNSLSERQYRYNKYYGRYEKDSKKE